ncbi:sulfotransferase [Pseudohaliea sp.]|uniref:sulfotransferase family protein n=1 Tax=Pseudohaliea sp. TaxID=2740289 RepID=UPI0032EBC59E
MTRHAGALDYPILIVGAGRSGTNLLAMALGEVTGIVNCFEQRYVWMKGQRLFGSDVRSAKEATPTTKRYIRKHFARVGRGARVVDKTPSNSLRLPFCRAVFPEAQIIGVFRDPFDNVASRLKELHMIGQEIPTANDTASASQHRFSILKDRIAHARRIVARGNIPLGRLPYAVVDQAFETLRIAITGRAENWGERVPGLADLRRAFDVEIAATHQWVTCNSHIYLGSRGLGGDNFMPLRYEDLVLKPAETGAAVAAFLGLGDPEPMIGYLTRNARPQTVGRHVDRMSEKQVEAIATYLEATARWNPGS